MFEPAPIAHPSVSRDINAERMMILAWPRAILLQLAHPLVAAGVADHSSVGRDPLTAARRLRQTIRAMVDLVFGGEEAQARTIAGIRAIHRRVAGTLRDDVGPFPAGTRYSAEDPALVLWVHFTLVDSIVRAHEMFFESLSPPDRDTYVVESAAVAMALGARESDVPQTWAGLQNAMHAWLQSGDIVVGPLARALMPAVTRLPWRPVTAPLSEAMRLLTFGQLPPGICAQYGQHWTERDQRRFASLVRVLRLTRRVTPRVIAVWPEARSGERTRARA